MQKLNQTEEAARFIAANESRLEAASKRLFERVGEFLTRTAMRHLPVQVVDEMRGLCEAKEMGWLAIKLRGEAVRLCAAEEGSVYWPLVDHTILFTDVTGTCWPYFTAADRERYLSWVEQYLDEQDSIQMLASA